MGDIRKPGEVVGQVQQARDVLAKWRGNAVSLFPWRLDEETGAVDVSGASIVGLDSRENASSAYLFPGDDRLIVGTAGNPDLLDAIDFSLSYVQEQLSLYEGRELRHVRYEDNGVVETALRIAAAIIAADERMTS